MGINLHDGDCAVAHLFPEKVPLHLKVLCSIGDALVHGKKKGAIVVFEDLALNCRQESVWKFETGDDFQEHGTEGQERAHGGAESGVLGFKGRQGNLTLEVRLPQDWTSAESDDVACARLCGAWRAIGVTAMEACKIRVDVTVDVQVAGWLDNHSHVASTVQVANKSLDGRSMAFLGIVAESGDLADCE